MHFRTIFPVLSATFALLISGCGSTVAVSGKVAFDGQAITEGSISFEAPDGSTPSMGARIVNGTYSISNESAKVAGKKVVRIVAAVKTGRKVAAGPPFPPGTMVDEIKNVPPQFNENSKLTADLTVDKLNIADFDLKSN